MGLIKITFDGSSVSSKQDADINYHVTGLVPAGIIRGLGSELSYTASNNYITFQDGYVQQTPSLLHNQLQPEHTFSRQETIPVCPLLKYELPF